MKKKSKAEIRKERKEEIAKVALHLFANYGFHNTSVSQIAHEAGISKGLIYNYFSGKDELLNYIIRDSFEHSRQLLQFRERDHLSPYELLVSGFENTLNDLKEKPSYYRLLILLTLQGDVKQKIIKDILDVKQELFPDIQKNLENMGVDPDESEKLYLLLGAAMDGLALHYLYMDEEYHLDEMFDYLRKKMIDPLLENKN